MKKKLISLFLCASLASSMLVGCGTTEEPATTEVEEATEEVATTEEVASELPTITFTHGYYHDESEWPAAAEMRAIYQEFADAHED